MSTRTELVLVLSATVLLAWAARGTPIPLVAKSGAVAGLVLLMIAIWKSGRGR